MSACGFARSLKHWKPSSLTLGNMAENLEEWLAESNGALSLRLGEDIQVLMHCDGLNRFFGQLDRLMTLMLCKTRSSSR